ncbi:GntR family transcriptional regulator [Paraburkholderia phenoliruptrix]|uniref:Transcriptional regulator, GntR family n=2 Tax=Paraburkholderia phenoliruptrix TaxID=252970 RepID=K0E1V8_9BURK|nr:GntR family transcriptional regulator [Paraburkholderia phenoliruptrix]AFT90458.1 Transcriptional regulator, GntR family [Paraburkholderia phenoliruptrix BR3459a]CAB4051868.1 HTH-type transcriptional repressor NagR [Paraburkholderia phenoliruptrix]
MSELASRYVQLADLLRETVRNAAPNTLLPTEEQLCAQFDVSRVTIRRALSILERSGLISRQRGRGTIVSPPKLTRNLFPACTIEQDFANQNIAIETKVLSFLPEPDVPGEVRNALDVGKRERVDALVLSRSIGSEVICHERRYIRSTIARKLSLRDIGKVSVSELLEQASGDLISHSDIETEILTSQHDVAEILRITQGALVFVVRFTEVLRGGKVLQVGEMTYRIDRVRFRMHQKGAPFDRREERG